MKSLKTFLLIAIVSLFSSASFAGNAHFFDVDVSQIIDEFAELTSLEDFVSSNEGVTLSMINKDSDLTSGLSLKALDALSSLSFFEPPLGIPSFLWGFCLGLIGILITYLVADSKDETKKALLGCVVGVLSWLLISVIMLVAGVGFLFAAS